MRHREAAADGATFPRVRTVINRARNFDREPIGNDWSVAHFDGAFWIARNPGSVPAVSVVFLQSRDGNTGGDPSALAAGEIDLHLIYEGLSRVAVDAVAVGASSLHSNSFLSIWRRELVALRSSLGLPRHPAQIVLSKRCRLDFDRILLFNVPDVPVFVLTNSAGCEHARQSLRSRPWVTVLATDGSDAVLEQFRELRGHDIHRVSMVGGRTAASALVDAGLVADLYLTTSPCETGEPGTPWYVGAHPPELRRLLAKSWDQPAGVVRFEHFETGGRSALPARDREGAALISPADSSQ